MSTSSHPAPPAVALSARWERSVVPVAGGEAMLLVRLTTPDASPDHRRAPVDVAFILDRSGSMSGPKLDLAKQAVDIAVGFLSDADQAALVTFDHTTQVVHPAQPATPRGKTALRLALPGIDAGGSTDLATGWLTGCREISDDLAPVPQIGSPRLRRALVLTDGQANVGITDPGTLTHHAHQLRQRGIGTTTLGIGEDFDELLLSGLAEAGGGNFQYIARAEQLQAFFARELNELLSVSAIGLTLQLIAPTGVRFTLVNAFPHQRQGKTLTVHAGDLPAGQTLDLIFEISAAGGRLGEVRTLELRATWADPRQDAPGEARLTTPALTYAQAATLAAVPSDPEVAAIAAVARATQERQAALRLDREGRHHESRRQMRAAADRLAAAPQTEAVRMDFILSDQYAAAPPTAYSEAARKQAAWENALRRRGRREAGPDTANPTTTPQP